MNNALERSWFALLPLQRNTRVSDSYKQTETHIQLGFKRPFAPILSQQNGEEENETAESGALPRRRQRRNWAQETKQTSQKSPAWTEGTSPPSPPSLVIISYVYVFMYVCVLQLISSGTSSKILKEALIQQKEINEEDERRNPNNLVFAEDVAAVEVVLEEDNIDDFGGFSETQSQFGGYEVWVLTILFYCSLFVIIY